MWKIFTSPLAGIIGSAASLILAGWFIATVLAKNGEINDLQKAAQADAAKIEKLTAANSTLFVNNTALESSLGTCNANVQATADVANAVAKAGTAALAEVQKAGTAVDRKVRTIDTMKAATCEDALVILKAGAN